MEALIKDQEEEAVLTGRRWGGDLNARERGIRRGPLREAHLRRSSLSPYYQLH